jgi:D-alanyl-D-alanine carboxypeptidase
VNPEINQNDSQIKDSFSVINWRALLLLIICLIGAGLAFNLVETSKNISKIAAVEKEDRTVENWNNPFDKVVIEGRSAFVWDSRNKKILYSKNEKEVMGIASITKLMTSIVALDIVPAFTTINITSKSLDTEGDSGLYANEKWRLRDLIQFSLTMSSNDGMSAIAESIGAYQSNSDDKELADASFVSLMNQYAQKLQLTNTNFKNETGLDKNLDTVGAYSTAEDVAKLMDYAIKTQPIALEATNRENFGIRSLSGISHLALNTNEIVGKIPNLIASKTGYTDLAGGNLVVAFNTDLDNPIIVSVLGSSREGRFSDVLRLVEATNEYLANKPN